MELTSTSSAGYGGLGITNLCPGIREFPGETAEENYYATLLLYKLMGAEAAQKFWTGWDPSLTDRNAFYKKYLVDMAKRYENAGYAWLKKAGIANPPTFDELRVANKQHGLTQWHPEEFIPDQDTYCGYQSTPGEVGKEFPLDTVSGKYEAYTDTLNGMYNYGKATTENTRNKEHFDYKKRKYAHMPNDWRDLQPISVFHPSVNGLEDPVESRDLCKKYPLYIMTPNSKFGTHWVQRDPGHPRSRDCTRHALVMSVVDALERGVKDNDIIRLWNDQGQVAVPAFVTARQSPGVIILRTGNRPSVSYKNLGGLDSNLGVMTLSGGCANTFTGGDDISPITPAKVCNSVEVEFYEPRSEE